MRLWLVLCAALLLAAGSAQAEGETIYRDVSGTLTVIPSRVVGKRYRMFIGPLNVPAYLEYTAAEETARDAEDALPLPPISGGGRCIAQRAGQVIPNNAGTGVDYTSEVRDIAGFHDNATNPDRFIVPVRQDGLYDLKVGVRFNEASAAAGCTANTGDRLVQLRKGLGGGSTALATVRTRASAASDTELTLSAPDEELVAGDVVRVFVAHSCGGTLTVDSRVSIRRVAPLE